MFPVVVDDETMPQLVNKRNQHRTQSKTICLLNRRWPKATFKKYKTHPQPLDSHKVQDMPQLLNKKPTQNTKQNHVPIKKKVAEGHLQKIQDTFPTTRLSQDTRRAPATKQETKTEHKAKPYAY